MQVRKPLIPLIREFVAKCGSDGATCDEISGSLGIPHHTVSPRVRELVLSGHLRRSNQRRKTKYDRMASVYVACSRRVPVKDSTGDDKKALSAAKSYVRGIRLNPNSSHRRRLIIQLVDRLNQIAVG